MFKKYSLPAIIVLLLLQFISFVTSPLCIDSCGQSGTLESQFHSNIILILAFISFIISFYKLTEKGAKYKILTGEKESILYLVISIFYFLVFLLYLYSKFLR